MYICFEGIDGSGKSTLAHAVYEQYKKQNKDVLFTKEPGSTPLGQEIRSIVQYAKERVTSRAEFLLYAADRAQHYAQVIKPALVNNQMIISDRSYVSSIAYQGYGRGLDVAMITQVNAWALEGSVPDLFIYLKITPEVAFERIHKRAEEVTRFEREKIDFFAHVIQGYEMVFKEYPNVIVLDAHKTQEELLQECLTALENYAQK